MVTTCRSDGMISLFEISSELERDHCFGGRSHGKKNHYRRFKDQNYQDLG